jgi:hypothetical protein
MTNSKKSWYQIEIEKDIKDTSGGELVKFLNILNKKINAEYVVLDYTTGAIGEHLYTAKYPTVMKLTRFLKLAKPATQFDWAYIYLFQKKKDANKLKKRILNTAQDPNFMENVETLVVVCDDTYFITYTRDKIIKEIIQKQYPTAKIEQKDIGELEFYF